MHPYYEPLTMIFMIQNIKYVLRVILAAVLGVVFAGSATAQENGHLKGYDFGYITRQDGWVSSLNAAGILSAPANISYVEAYYDKTKGGLHNYYQSPDIFLLGIKTESFRKVGNVGFYGKMQYEYYEGKDWAGSIFIDPSLYPFDMVEHTPGRKLGENYIFEGGIGFRLAGSLYGGLRIEYEADNIAKRRNLRHKNNRMNLRAVPSLTYKTGNWDLGLSYIYKKLSERVQLEVIGGSTEGGYRVFYDKGLWFGVDDLWTAGSVHLTDAGIGGFPLKFEDHGASFQSNYNKGAVRFYEELTYRRSAGETGGKGITWMTNRADIIEYKGVLNLADAYNEGLSHLIHAGASYGNQKNYESITGTEMVAGTPQETIIGSYIIMHRRTLSIGAEYEMAFRRTPGDYNPYLSLRAGFEYCNRNTLGLLAYPYVKSQTLSTRRMHVQGETRFDAGTGELKLRASLGYSYGDGTKLDETVGNMSPGAEPGEYPVQNTDYFEYEYEYLTTGKADVSLGIRYTTYVGRSSLPLYADLSWNTVNAPQAKLLPGKCRNSVLVKVGVVF